MLPELDSRIPALRKRLIRPFVIDVNPNIISIAALLISFAAGYALWQNRLIEAAILVLLNGFLDILDGEIAKEFGRQTKLGDFIDHSFDRIADVAIILGLTFNPAVPDMLGYFAAILVLLVSYLGTEAQALTSHRLYTAWLGRGDRLLVIAVAAIAGIWYAQALYWAVIIILALSAISFVQRFVVIAKMLRRDQKA